MTNPPPGDMRALTADALVTEDGIFMMDWVGNRGGVHGRAVTELIDGMNAGGPQRSRYAHQCPEY